MKLPFLLFLLIPFVSYAQEGAYQLECDYNIEKVTDSTFKIQVTNFDSINGGESCFQMWMNTAKGKPNGKLFVYDENGNKRRMAIYKDNVRTGTHLEWYSTGELESETHWETDLYFNSKGYYPSGKIKHIAEDANRKNAVYKSYFESGQIESLSDYSGEGDKYWYENGILKMEINRKENFYKEWYSNGKLKMKGNLINGWTRIGKWIYYNEKGKRTRKLFYENENSNRSYYGDETGFKKEKKYK